MPAVPLTEWTSTRHGHANALLWLGTREGGRARLEEAVAALEPVPTECVRERVPMQCPSAPALKT